MKKLIVLLNDHKISDEQLSYISELRIDQKLSLPTACELVLLVNKQNKEILEKVEIGSEVKIRVVMEKNSYRLFEGDITAVEYAYNPDEGPHCRVRAFDQLHRMRKHQAFCSYQQVSLLDLFKELGKESNVNLQPCNSSSAQMPLWQKIIQLGKSHFEFLQRCCRQNGLFFFVREKKVHITTLKGFGKKKTELKFPENLLEYNFLVNSNHSAKKVRLNSWNNRLGSALPGKANKARSGRKIKAAAPSSKVGGADLQLGMGTAVEDDKHAKALASADLDCRAAQEVVFSGRTTGLPTLHPGCQVSVSAVAPKVCGDYVLTKVSHIMTGEFGYQCEVTTEAPEFDAIDNAVEMFFGVVSNVDDPEKCGRIQVNLESFGKVETDWMQVAAAGVGKDKGLFMLPAVGDQVIVICPSQNPSQGVVIGSILGTQKTKDAGIEGGKVKRFSLRTPNGNLVALDDSKDSIRIEAAKGSFIEFSGSGIKISAKGNLDLLAAGKNVSVSAAKIELKQG